MKHSFVFLLGLGLLLTPVDSFSTNNPFAPVSSSQSSVQVPATHVMEVNTRKLGAMIQPTMYGMFFEDINYAADGGLYAELIKNRSFEFPQALMGWQAFGRYEIRDNGPFDRCPHYILLKPAGHPAKSTGLVNEGYFGIGIQAGEEYRFSVWAKAEKKAMLSVQLIDTYTSDEQQQFVETYLEINSPEWKKYTITLKPSVTKSTAQLRIFLLGDEPVSMDHISLFPINTFRGRENGCRADIAQALADCHPGVFRFPGGCIVEGADLATRYNWKNSVGPVENRPLNENRWLHSFSHRLFPDYFQSYGLGFFEFFQLAEDMGAEPLPVVSCGLACQYQNGNFMAKYAAQGVAAGDDGGIMPGAHADLDQLDCFIQDALDLIEFANGDISTTWGKLRAQMGHPDPFNMKYLGVGNEQWDYLDNAAYTDRLKAFVKELRKQHPEIQIVGGTGPDASGWKYDLLQPRMKELKVDLVDEHFYSSETWFADTLNTLRYENYDRKGPRIFAGEYACHVTGKKWNQYMASILEAGFMTDFERNADLVTMTAYAPLLAHVDGWQWRPDMVWFDNLNVVKTCSYYVQQLYATNRGTHMLRLIMDGKPVANLAGQDGLEASAVWDANDHCVIVKVANISSAPQSFTIQMKGLQTESSLRNSSQLYAETISLSSDLWAEDNTLASPELIVPTTGQLALTQTGKLTLLNDTLPAMSFRIYRVKAMMSEKK